MERYIKIRDACEILGVSRPTVYKLIEQKLLPAVRTGATHRINRADVEALNRTGWVWADATS